MAESEFFLRFLAPTDIHFQFKIIAFWIKACNMVQKGLSGCNEGVVIVPFDILRVESSVSSAGEGKGPRGVEGERQRPPALGQPKHPLPLAHVVVATY